MVFYFKSSNSKYMIYMGKDKYENEDLIKYGIPTDIWFHVSGLSSAHVYLRLNEEETMDDIPEEVLKECAQLVKENSRDGRKKQTVSVCYTPWSNLLKRASMDVGEVSFKDDKLEKFYHGVSKDNTVLNYLKKTMEEKIVNLEAEQNSYKLEVANKRKKIYEDQKQAEIDMNRKYKEIRKEKTYGFMNEVEEEGTNKSGKDLDDDFW